MADPRQMLEAKKAQVLETARKEAAQIEHDIQELERMKALAEKYGLEIKERGADKPEGHTVSIERRIIKRVRRSSAVAEPISRRVRREAEILIRATGKPLPARQLFADALKKGLKIKGKRPESTYSAFLHGADNLELAHRGWWWIKGLPVPAGWEPDTEKAA